MFKIAILLVVVGLGGCTRDAVTVVDAKAGTFLRRDKVLGGLYWCEKTRCELVTGVNALTALVATTPPAGTTPPPDGGKPAGGNKTFRFDAQGNPIP